MDSYGLYLLKCNSNEKTLFFTYDLHRCLYSGVWAKRPSLFASPPKKHLKQITLIR